MVYLEKADGGTVSIALTQLTADDQALAKKQTAATQTEQKKPAPLMKRKKKRIPGTLTDEEIAELKTAWRDEKTGKALQFKASFGAARVEPAQRKRYRNSGKIPTRITMALYEITERGGRKMSKRLTGTGRMYVLDSEGNLAFKKSMSLSKLCPT